MKGRNREFFENKLVQNIKQATKIKKVVRKYGRLLLETEKDVTEILKKIPGIAFFAKVERAKLDIADINKTAEKILKKEKGHTFTIKTKRSNKNFPLKSPDVNKEIVKYVEKKLGKSGEYKNAEIKLFVDITDKEVFLYSNKIKGIGGLPVRSCDSLVCLLSGGLDSPVAAYMMMKRGCEIIFVHFYNDKLQKNTDKIEELAEQLTKYQLKTKIYLIPFGELQQELILKVPAKTRMIIYRRYMIKIANKISEKEKIEGLVTGDNLGQVASQTVANLKCAYAASKIPVFSPLIGLNKEEIMNIAKEIGTYDISIKKYADCCSYLVPQHPETRGHLKTIEKIEQEIDAKIVEKVLKKAKIKEYKI